MGFFERADLTAASSLASIPNNSVSIVSGEIVAELMVMKGPLARADASWIPRAVSSLPAPGAPGDQNPRIGGPTRSTT